MAVGETTSGVLSAALPEIVADARIVHEDEGTWRRTCDIKRQTPNTGLNWSEFALDQLARQDITETTDNRNFQQLSGTLLSVEPQMTQILIKMTDRMARKIASVVKDKFGSLAGNAMARGDDEDYIAMFASFGTGTSPGSGNPLSFGHISAAVNRIKSNTTETSDAAVFAVLHGFQIKDIQDEVLAGVGTYTIPTGLTEAVFRKGFEGTVAGANVYKDSNIGVVSSNARGAVHSREGVVAAIGMEIKKETDRDMYFGGGADVISLTNEHAFVERSAGNWAYTILSDATAPTS
jgi:hypothetical protein